MKNIEERERGRQIKYTRLKKVSKVMKVGKAKSVAKMTIGIPRD
jgi:hypothetical protein